MRHLGRDVMFTFRALIKDTARGGFFKDADCRYWG